MKMIFWLHIISTKNHWKITKYYIQQTKHLNEDSKQTNFVKSLKLK